MYTTTPTRGSRTIPSSQFPLQGLERVFSKTSPFLSMKVMLDKYRGANGDLPLASDKVPESPLATPPFMRPSETGHHFLELGRTGGQDGMEG